MAYKVEPARVPQGSVPTPAEGSEVWVYLSPSFNELTQADGIADAEELTVALPPELPFPLEISGAGEARLGGQWIAQVDSEANWCDWELRQLNGRMSLTVRLPPEPKSSLKTQALSFWYLSGSPPQRAAA